VGRFGLSALSEEEGSEGDEIAGAVVNDRFKTLLCVGVSESDGGNVTLTPGVVSESDGGNVTLTPVSF
jgi:hypothetical protein